VHKVLESGPPNGILLLAWPSLQCSTEVRGNPYFHRVTFLDSLDITVIDVRAQKT